MATEFCPRCQGGAIPAENCPVCGGSGFITGDAAPATTIPTPFRRNAWRTTRAEREKEKARRVKVLKVSLTPEEQARQELEERERQREAAERRAKMNRVAKRPRNGRERYQTTREGVVATPVTPRRSTPSRDDPGNGQGPSSTTTAPKSSGRRGPKLSKWSTPEHSRRRREALEAKLDGQLADVNRSANRPSREEASAATVANDQLAQQLAGLLSKTSQHPAPDGPATSKPNRSQKAKGHVRHETPKPDPAVASHTPEKPAQQRAGFPSAAQRREERKARGKARLQEEARKPKKAFMPVRNGRIARRADPTQPSESRFATMESNRQRGGSNKGLPGDDTAEQAGDPAVASLAEERHREEDAGRYYGTSFRESDGRFGSLPLYDDYDG